MMKRASWIVLTLSLLSFMSPAAVRANPSQAISGAILLVLTFQSTSGTFKLRPMNGATFRLESFSGLEMRGLANLRDVNLTNNSFSVNFSTVSNGTISVAVQATNDTSFTVDPGFTGNVTATWPTASGPATETVNPGTTLSLR